MSERETTDGRAPDPDAPAGVPTKDKQPDGQYAAHYVLSAEERAKGKVRPVRESYRHEKCGTVTKMPLACAETYAKQPTYYGSTFCCACCGYFPVGASGEFVWLDDGTKVGT